MTGSQRKDILTPLGWMHGVLHYCPPVPTVLV
jgi:hypothetical protein